MTKTIRAPDLESSFRTVLDEIVREHIPYVVTENSRPEAVIVPYEQFLKLQKFQEEEVLARFDRLRARMAEQNAEFSEEEVDRDITAG